MNDRPSDSGTDARSAVYGHYVALKGWTPWTYGSDEAEGFRGELGTEDLRGKRLFEIGFGSGGLLAWAAERGADVAGSEINPECLAAARDRDVELLPTDLTNVVDDHIETFDIIIAFDVFEHLALDEVRSNLQFCAMMLKPGGVMLVRFPNCQSPFGLLHQHGDITHRTPLSGDQMRQLVMGLPLEVAEVRPAYRVRGPTLGRKLVRSIRYVLQDLIQAFVRFAYVYTAPLAPVVTVVLRRSDPGVTPAHS